MNIAKKEWVDKYRPQNLKDYVLDKSIKDKIEAMIKNNSLQGCTFRGIQGSGKTTLARILANEFDAELLFVKCATEGTVDVVRAKIEPFCNAMSIDGRTKVVILDELDSASSSGTNSFQMALRTVIEAAKDDTRFICTANKTENEKVISPILSRCPIIPLRFDKKELLVYLTKILDLEKIEYTKEDLRDFIEQTFKFYPDCRRIVNYLQFCCNTGKLVANLDNVVDEERESLLNSLIEKIKNSSKIMDIRSFYLQQKSKISDYKTLGAELTEKAIDNKLLDDARAILKASDINYQMNLVVNPEIQFFALVCLIFGACHAK